MNEGGRRLTGVNLSEEFVAQEKNKNLTEAMELLKSGGDFILIVKTGENKTNAMLKTRLCLTGKLIEVRDFIETLEEIKIDLVQSFIDNLKNSLEQTKEKGEAK